MTSPEVLAFPYGNSFYFRIFYLFCKPSCSFQMGVLRLFFSPNSTPQNLIIVHTPLKSFGGGRWGLHRLKRYVAVCLFGALCSSAFIDKSWCTHSEWIFLLLFVIVIYISVGKRERWNVIKYVINSVYWILSNVIIK